MEESISVFWFRRDLRLQDNVALYHALKGENKVLPIFIFDPNILDNLPKNDPRVQFIVQNIRALQKELMNSVQSSIAIFHDTPENVFTSLLKTYRITHVYANHDYEPYALKRDHIIDKLLNTHVITFKTFKDHVIFEKDEIVKKDGTAYKVYTPYKKMWKNSFNKNMIAPYDSKDLLNNLYSFQNSILNLSDINFQISNIEVPSFILTKELIQNYEETRDFPAINKGTSLVGTYLRFGIVSIRSVIKKAIQEENETFLSELIWREFFMQILWHYPHTVTKSFKPKYDLIKWRNDRNDFEKWKKGETGYPLVDAGMRQLNTSGFMHNRIRMLVGSFLCKHLLIDWRWGEAYFAEKLLDYEQSANIGNWQWVAGTGVDAAPYFRIFNPTTHIQKFDKELIYIRRWVKDFDELTYPLPMVDHKEARTRCLNAYKEAIQLN